MFASKRLLRPSGQSLRGGLDSRELVRTVRAQAPLLQGSTDRDLRDRYADLRSDAFRRDAQRDALLPRLLALVTEALRRTIGIELYDVQLVAGAALSRGCIAEMQTGEGKTFAIVLPACWYALNGEGVHVVTANAYLAERDLELLRPAYECLGLTAALLPERAGVEPKRRAYDCDITYGTGYEFGFDFLRDQLARSGDAREPLGSGYLRRLRGQAAAQSTMQRGLAHAIVDEVDNVLLDDACSPLVIAQAVSTTAPDAAAHRLAWTLSEVLNRDSEYVLDFASGRVSLTAAGLERIHAANVPVPMQVLERPWAEYVRQALRARCLLQRDIHYVVADDEVRIVDGSTGRIFEDRTWQDGLHQAIEAKEGLPINAERRPLAGVTRQRYFQQYRLLCGLTGTARGAESEFRKVYGLSVEAIPLHRPSQFVEGPTRFFGTAGKVEQAIAVRVRELQAAGRPVLVGTTSIQASGAISTQLTVAGIAHQVLNGRQDAAEADVIAAAGRAGAVTIATNLAGRGTDIKLTSDAAQAGGLHVIACGRQRARRIDRQLMGRSARQGAPGSAECCVSSDDTFLREQAPWLCERIARRTRAGSVIADDLSTAVDRVQRRVERHDAAVRQQLWEQDRDRDSVWSKLETFAA